MDCSGFNPAANGTLAAVEKQHDGRIDFFSKANDGCESLKKNKGRSESRNKFFSVPKSRLRTDGK